MNRKQFIKEAWKNMDYNNPRLDPDEQERYDRAQIEFYNWMSQAAEDFVKQNPNAFIENTIGVCFKLAIDFAKELSMPDHDIKKLFDLNLKTKRGVVANCVLAFIGQKLYDPLTKQSKA